MTYTWKLNPQPNGQYTRSNSDGTVMSVDEDGNVQTRPAGTTGPWELCDLRGAALHFQPARDRDTNAPIYVFFPEA